MADKLDNYKKLIQISGIIIGVISIMPVYAYIGPGAGVSSVGFALAFVFVLLLLFIGFVWYPLKAIFSKKKSIPDANERESNNSCEKSLDKDSDKARKF